MEKSQEEHRFSEIIAKHLNGGDITSDEKMEILTIAKNNKFRIEQKENNISGEVKMQDCYWICKGSNWSCNPDAPGPGCECYKVCI